MTKKSLHLIFILQMYVPVDSLEEDKDFVEMIWTFNELTTIPSFFCFNFNSRNAPANKGKW